jgi:hypothetical protein
MVSAILVADHGNEAYFAIGRHSLGLVGFIEKRIHSFKDAFGDTRRLAKPDRRANDNNVCGNYFFAELGPSVTPAFVEVTPGFIL